MSDVSARLHALEAECVLLIGHADQLEQKVCGLVENLEKSMRVVDKLGEKIDSYLNDITKVLIEAVEDSSSPGRAT